MIVVQSLLGNHYSFSSSLHCINKEIDPKKARVWTYWELDGSFNFLFILPLSLPLLLFLL